MKKFLKISLVLAVLMLINKAGFSQLHVSVETLSQNKVGLGYSFSDRLWTELRFYEAFQFSDFTPEMVFCVNLVKKEYHAVYLGVGGVINYYTGLTVPVGTQIFPFEKNKNLSLNIEFQTILGFGSGDLAFQTQFGLKYRFGKKCNLKQ